jgi:hypothetical protein
MAEETPATAFPLQWPSGRPRTEHWRREQAKFDVTFARARDNIVAEIGRLAGRYPDPQIVISTNIALRRDGLPLANQRQPDDPGVAVYFLYKKRAVAFACDRWVKIEHNMQAIAKTIEALRGIARWGTGDMLAAAFTGDSPPCRRPALRHPGQQRIGTGARCSEPAFARALTSRTCTGGSPARTTLTAAAIRRRWPN